MRTTQVAHQQAPHTSHSVYATAASLLMAWLASAVVASAAPATSVLAGTVSRMDGARLPRATVTLTERARGHQLISVSDELGSFLVHDVPDGTYDLVAEFPGPDAARHDGARHRGRFADRPGQRRVRDRSHHAVRRGDRARSARQRGGDRGAREPGA